MPRTVLTRGAPVIAARKANIRNLLFAENSMIRLIIQVSKRPPDPRRNLPLRLHTSPDPVGTSSDTCPNRTGTLRHGIFPNVRQRNPASYRAAFHRPGPAMRRRADLRTGEHLL